ncbi:MAG: hypothetical protein WCF84_23310 [Anaerolineae bacterium]
MIRCGFCGCEFDPAAAPVACAACPVARGCHLIRCPHCGYEMPPEPALFKWFRRLAEKRREA